MKKIIKFLAPVLAFAAAGCSQTGLPSVSGFSVTDPATIVVTSADGSTTINVADYTSLKKKGGAIVGTAEIETGECSFFVTDTWKNENGELSLSREVKVAGSIPGAGFYSEVNLSGKPACEWRDLDFIIPGVIYGKPHTTDMAKGGNRYYDAGFFSVREDVTPAPVIAVYDGSSWVAVMDPAPDGSTTWEEATSRSNDRLVDGQFGFGSFGIYDNDGVTIRFRFPGTSDELNGTKVRMHPVEDGFVQNYSLSVTGGTAATIMETEKSMWRWAWDALDPQIQKVDLDEVKTALIDHLMDRIVRYEDRAGIPFVIDAVSGKPGSFRPAGRMSRPAPPIPELDKIVEWAGKIGIDIDPSAAELDIWPWAVVGFCGKHVELSGQFLRESYLDDSERGARLRETAEAVMNTLVKYFPVDPPVGEGLDLRTGKAGNIHGGNSFSTRPIAEDMAMLIELLQAEKEHGRTHDDWLAWGVRHAEWLLSIRNGDGSIPGDFGSDGKVSDASGVKTYALIPFFTRLSAFTGEKKYLDAAVKAGDALWKISGCEGVYRGATGNSKVADKESGMLSLNAFLSLYDATGDAKWLDYAKAAADYTETWIWIWNNPMPIGADPAQLGWKPGVPTIGVNAIGSDGPGGADQYLDWGTPLFAQLYKLTGDEHYLDVTKILLHGTKAMLAIPGRTYDMPAPGWQQEHWQMSGNRGQGAHRTWLPWISINHIHSITGVEDLDPELFKQLK